MSTFLQKFAVDLISAGISAAAVAVLALDLNSQSAKAVALIAAIAFLNGVINAARRALPAS